MPLHTGCLVLTPVDPLDLPDRSEVRRVLAGAGLLAEPIPGRTHEPPGDASGADVERFRVGPRLLELLIFAGCAVRIDTAPGDGAAFCHLRIPPPAPTPRLLAGRNTRPPRCPRCRVRLGDWRSHLSHWADGHDLRVSCPACAHAGPPWDWDWKQQGGFGRVFVMVEEVFPGEAVPTPALLDLLQDLAGTPWRHFYVQE